MKRHHLEILVKMMPVMACNRRVIVAPARTMLQHCARSRANGILCYHRFVNPGSRLQFSARATVRWGLLCRNLGHSFEASNRTSSGYFSTDVTAGGTKTYQPDEALLFTCHDDTPQAGAPGSRGGESTHSSREQSGEEQVFPLNLAAAVQNGNGGPGTTQDLRYATTRKQTLPQSNSEKEVGDTGEEARPVGTGQTVLDQASIRLTRAAARRLELINARRRAETLEPYCLRLHVEGGGCAGFHYEFRLETDSDARAQEHQDMVFIYGGNRLLVNKAFEDIFDDCVIDYEEELIGSQFVIRQNKAAAGSCNCGHSFEVPGLGF